MGRRVDSPDTGRARKRQDLMSKEHARTFENPVAHGGTVMSPRAGAQVAGGPTPGQGKSAVVRVMGMNKKPLPLSIVRAGIPEGATETAKNSAGCAVQPVRLICAPGFQVLSVAAGGVERLREDHRKEGVPSERFAADAPDEQMHEFLDLSTAVGANKPITIKVKRLGEESRFEATLFAIPCEEPAPPPSASPAPPAAPAPSGGAPLPPPSFDPFAP